MDVLAHALWTNAVFYTKYAREKRQRYMAALFGVLPDLVSFIPLSAYLLFHTDQFSPRLFAKPIWEYRWAAYSYHFTHSLVIFVFAFLVVLMIRKGKVYWPMLGWGLHIVIDIFTHKDVFETPFLFPLSHYTNHYAVPWSHPLFMLINYAVLGLVYVYIFYWRKRHGIVGNK